MNTLVRTLQNAVSIREAEPAASRLEADYFPHQYLMPGCAQLVAALFEGLPSATPVGTSETWAMLVQIAAGTARESGESPTEIATLRTIFTGQADAAVRRLEDANPQPYDFFVLDVIDSMLLFADPGLQSRGLRALESFKGRGPKEAQAADVILHDYRA